VEETVKSIAEKTGRSRTWIYEICKELGRLPTVEEVNARKNKVGRPKKYKPKESE
jgi:predicted transcriptional regulator